MKPVENDEYTSTDLREMQAYYAGLQANSTSFGIGESLSDEDLENFKGVL